MFLDKRLTRRNNDSKGNKLSATNSSASEHCWYLEFAFKNATLAESNPTQEIIDALVQCGLPETSRVEVHTILNELYVNALDYGVLGLADMKKSDDEAFYAFYDERKRRLKRLEQHSETQLSWVKIDCVLNIADRPSVEITVADSGGGYTNVKREACSDNRLNGRGLILVKALALDLRYIGHNNQVKVVYQC